MLGLTLEPIIALTTAAEDAAFLLEVGHAHSGKLRRFVMGSSIVMNLMNRDSGVNNVRLDGFYQISIRDRGNGNN